ncbi:glycosyltransferase family 4 protein [Sporohalobacter salinus]|uniref:glycosyltransferase family 4 protein n=1 Tax=Sporohalobacter salinus TaxID=1494606 RepID=UPI001961B35F|nr:glycosyltransferase family 4 protein [Sporohalobacter salinus]MBM7622955.1 UDP-glucose:(heptosyl)LPS alpha-1,3-glucosyltransferase [Sporohalobacter salinus]
MKIALVHKKYTTHGGTERYMVGLSNFLVQNGHQVHVFTGSWNEKVADDRITFHKVPCWGKHLGIDKYIFARSVYKKVQKYNFDIVQTFSRVGFGDVIRIGGGCHENYVQRLMGSIDDSLYKLKKRLEYKLSFDDYFTRYYEAKDFKPNNYKKIVAVSQMVKDEVIAKYQVPAEDIIVNHNGVNIKKFHPENQTEYRLKIRKEHGLDKDDLVLLFVGTGFRRKGLEYILKAMTKINGVKLLVVGKGKINRFKRKARELNILSNVIFAGPVSNVEAYYAAGDIFVFPSIYDPCANVSLEAMASGLPLITTQTNGASGIINHGENGFILDNSENVEQLISYIKRLTDQDLRAGMSKAAREKMLDYTKEANHQKMLEVYRQIANKQRSESRIEIK